MHSKRLFLCAVCFPFDFTSLGFLTLPVVLCSGEEVSYVAECPKCGAWMSDSANACTKCGAKKLEESNNFCLNKHCIRYKQKHQFEFDDDNCDECAGLTRLGKERKEFLYD